LLDSLLQEISNMSNLMKGKKYGLIMPSKAEPLSRANPLANSKMGSKPSIFGQDSSDSDDGGASGEDWVKKSLKVKANNSGLKKQAKIQMAKALEEDPTVFQYDEVYDDIERKKEVEKESKKDVDRKPKYVHNLLKAADERQKEFERRIERQVQKEREAEGNEFADKESFVTSAYRKKMEEIAKQEEEEARTARIEAALDVTKQNNMDGFYRHLYRQTMGEEKGQVESKVESEESEEAKAARVKEEIKKIKIVEDQVEDNHQSEPNFTIKKIDKKKEFRKKEEVESSSDSGSSSGSDDESDNEDSRKDATNETEATKVELMKQKLKEQKEKRERRKRKIEEDASSSESEPDDTEMKKLKPDQPEEKQDDNPQVVVEESAPKVDIWKKRTVGEVYNKAVQRYWERKAAREAGS